MFSFLIITELKNCIADQRAQRLASAVDGALGWRGFKCDNMPRKG